MQKKITYLVIHFSLFCILLQPLAAQSLLDPQLDGLFTPKAEKFQLYSTSITKRTAGTLAKLTIFQYFNPNGTLAKTDSLFQGQIRQTKIFFYRPFGKVFRVIAQDFSGQPAIRFEERYHYDSQNRLVRIEKLSMSGLQIMNQQHPLLMLEAKLSYDSKNRLIKTEIRELDKPTFFTKEKLSPETFSSLFQPAPILKDELTCKEWKYSYDSQNRKSAEVHRVGECGKMGLLQRIRYDHDDHSTKTTIEIPGIFYKKVDEKHFANGVTVKHKEQYFIEDALQYESDKSFSAETGLLNSWQEREKKEQLILTYQWHFNMQPFEIKATFLNKEAKKITVPFKGTRQSSTGVHDREILFTYDQTSGYLARETLYQMESGTRNTKSFLPKQMIYEKENQYNPNMYHFKYQKK